MQISYPAFYKTPISIIGRFKHANRDSSRLGIGGASSHNSGSTANTSNGKTGSNGQKDFLTDPPRIPPRLEMLLDMPPVPRDIQVKHSWNQDDRYKFKLTNYHQDSSSINLKPTIMIYSDYHVLGRTIFL